ncbi:MAG: hypothetical protein ABFD79_09350 [Phycisphaerales bacterium]
MHRIFLVLLFVACLFITSCGSNYDNDDRYRNRYEDWRTYPYDAEDRDGRDEWRGSEKDEGLQRYGENEFRKNERRQSEERYEGERSEDNLERQGEGERSEGHIERGVEGEHHR